MTQRPSATVTFGVISTAVNARVGQLALKSASNAKHLAPERSSNAVLAFFPSASSPHALLELTSLLYQAGRGWLTRQSCS